MPNSSKNKKLIGLLYSLFTFLLFQGCSTASLDSPDMPSTEYLNVTNQISIPSEGDLKATLEIKADCGWTISGNPSWMTLSANSGNGNADITITCTPNPSSLDERSAVLSVTSASGKIKRQVTVIQGISTEFIEINVSELQFPASEESKILSISSNTKWSILGVDQWLTLSRETGEGNTDITVTVKQNTSEQPRWATLTIQGTNASARVSINQEGKSTVLSISPTTITARAVGSSYTLSIEGDAVWTASSNAQWLILSKSTGEGNANISVDVSDHLSLQEREALITVSTSKNTYTCNVKQEAATVPEVFETLIIDIEKYSVKAQSSFQSEFIILECGFCFSTSNMEPTTKDIVAPCTDTDSTTFIADIIGLKSGKKYYIRAFAKSVVGINYGPVREFTTKGDIPGSGDNPTPEV